MQTANHPSNSPAKQQGFTLLELLIASIIFAIMAIMAYGGLANVMDNSKASQTALKRLQQIQQSVSVLNRDLLQILPRAVRDEYGNVQPALSAGNNIDNLVEFTRGGRVNPANLLRSTLLRVAYRFDDEKLLRLQWPQLDNAPGVEAKQTILIDDVENVSIRFLDQNGEWQEQWPPLNADDGSNTGNTTGPTAIEVVLQLNDWGEIRRLYAMN
ncbi:MAG: type II secretion system minor pseudopilin GspJ [Proteobacteria bacterium]|nr:type II secretion system minor pseudopilin GspJ [Pseudomonadota bacterium]